MAKKMYGAIQMMDGSAVLFSNAASTYTASLAAPALSASVAFTLPATIVAGVMKMSSGGAMSSGPLVNADIDASAAIAESKLYLDYSTSSLNTAIGGKLSSSLAEGKIFVGSAGGAAVAQSMSADATLAASGALTIANSAITNAKVASDAAIAFTKMAELTSHSKVLVSNSSGVVSESSVSSTTLGYLDATSSIQTQLNATEKSANKGAANGYAPLDSSSKVPYANLPSAIMTYKGAWDASSNTPTLADGTGANGDTYRVSVAGTQDLGAGAQTFVAGDFVIYNGTIWQHSPLADTVHASKALDNLAAVAVSASLTPGTTNSIDLGSSTKVWAVGYVNKIQMASNSQVTTVAGSASASASVDYKLPVAAPTSSGQVLASTTGGVMSWVDQSSFSMPSFKATWINSDTATKVVVHSLGSTDVMVQIYDNDTLATIDIDSVVRTTSNSVTLTASSAPASGGSGWRVMVLKV